MRLLCPPRRPTHYSLYIDHGLEKGRGKRWRGKAMDDGRTKVENILPLCEKGGETEGLCVLKKGRFGKDEAMRKWPKEENGTMKEGREGILEGKRRRCGRGGMANVEDGRPQKIPLHKMSSPAATMHS
jgi:hypothetical protein